MGGVDEAFEISGIVTARQFAEFGSAERKGGDRFRSRNETPDPKTVPELVKPEDGEGIGMPAFQNRLDLG